MLIMTTHSVDDILRPETRARLVKLARELERDPAELLDDAVRDLEERRRYLEAMDAGLKDAEAGRIVDGDEVDGWLATWGSANEVR